ncbi:MAG: hypothetical protein HC896_06130, partial [Bacteroidales bacterium]|nr:hypothetical protein [Bacteroidales bacterium]
MKAEKPDILHTWGSFAPVVAVPSAVLLRLNFVNSIVTHAKVGFMGQEYFRGKISIPFSSLVLGNSRAGLKAFKVPASKARVVYNGYNFVRNKTFDMAATRTAYGIKTRFVVGMVAAFHVR